MGLALVEVPQDITLIIVVVLHFKHKLVLVVWDIQVVIYLLKQFLVVAVVLQDQVRVDITQVMVLVVQDIMQTTLKQVNM